MDTGVLRQSIGMEMLVGKLDEDVWSVHVTTMGKDLDFGGDGRVPSTCVNPALETCMG